MATRIGVDVGGTFTDLVFYDEQSGRTYVAKGPSTPSRPDEGVIDVVQSVTDAEKLARTAYFLHGTTVGLNALLERKGARVGLITTSGFRDVLELRRGTRGDAMYDTRYVPQAPLVPRHLRIGIGERILADGTVERSPETDDVRQALDTFREHDVDAIAVCLINAYVHPQHELQIEATLRQLGFEGALSLSHRISGELREFERTATTVVDAYVRPAVSRYLNNLDDSLRDNGFDGESLITRSGGGSMSFAEAQERPFETVMSGPVAGAVGAGALARELGLQRAITADVGGTSFDTCLLVDGSPLVKYEGQVGDLPLQTQWVDVRSIGSGGGSIAYVEDGAFLRVGPESAGANPGPACYGRGGTRATTTDAAAALGMLAFGELAGGLKLDIPASESAIDAIGSSLRLTRDEAASGIVTIAGAAMAGAVRSVTIEQGEDPREAALLAFGGAGPMLSSVIAAELDISLIVVPEHAGNFSAYSLLSQDVTRASSATLMCPLDAAGVAAASRTVSSLSETLANRTDTAQTAPGKQSLEVALELRYVGQLYTLAVPWNDPSPDSAAGSIAKDFEAQYEKIFGHSIEAPVEVVAVRANIREPLPNRGTNQTAEQEAQSQERTCGAYSFELGKRTDFAVRDRSSLSEQPADGPMIVLEPTTTTYIDAGWTVHIGPHAAMMIARKDNR